MTPHTFTPAQPPQCLPKRIRPLGPGALLLTLAPALGAAACGPEAGNGNGAMNDGGNGSMNGANSQDVAVAAGG